MNQTTLNFNAIPKNPFNAGTQVYRIYEHLRECGELTTRQIHQLGCDCARLRSDIRPFLKSKGYDYRCEYLEEGNRLYKVVRG